MPERVRVQICRVVVEAVGLSRCLYSSIFLHSHPVVVQGEFCRGGNIDLGTVETEAGSVCRRGLCTRRRFAVLKILTKMSLNVRGR